jgi:RHH-type rel operon transcriptional repressor/antitoxin RelB
MASINVRIDDDLKARAYHELEKLGVTPSELMRQALQYVAERGQLPFKPVLMPDRQ